jgi:hypothetical protein
MIGRINAKIFWEIGVSGGRDTNLTFQVTSSALNVQQSFLASSARHSRHGTML